MGESLRRLISEDEFAAVLRPTMAEFLVLGSWFDEMLASERFRQYLSLLSEQANEVESFLDEYGARTNRRFGFLGRLVASVRWISRGLFAVEHLASRFEGYFSHAGESRHEEFRSELQTTQRFLQESLGSLVEACGEEADRLGCVEDGHEARVGKGIPGTNPEKRMLPQNIDELEDVPDEERRIIEVASRFRLAQEEIGQLKVAGRLQDPATIRKVVSQRYDEEAARRLEARIHGLQAKYDTYVSGTRLEKAHPELRELRGYTSVVLHLLESGTNLVHFYERHESDIRSASDQSRLAELVDESRILERIHNFTLLFVDRYAREGREVAEGIIPLFTTDVTYDLAVPAGTWVHVRPAHRIVAIVNHYGSPVEMEIEGERCEASSILQVMMLMGNHADARVIRFRGDEKPLGDLRALFDADLGEGEKDLPDRLGYLG